MINAHTLYLQSLNTIQCTCNSKHKVLTLQKLTFLLINTTEFIKLFLSRHISLLPRYWSCIHTYVNECTMYTVHVEERTSSGRPWTLAKRTCTEIRIVLLPRVLGRIFKYQVEIICKIYEFYISFKYHTVLKFTLKSSSTTSKLTLSFSILFTITFLKFTRWKVSAIDFSTYTTSLIEKCQKIVCLTNQRLHES